MNSLISRCMPCYGNTDIYNTKASEAVREMVQYWEERDFLKVAKFFGDRRGDIARAAGSKDAERFGVFRNESLITPLSSEHRRESVWKYLNEHGGEYRIAYDAWKLRKKIVEKPIVETKIIEGKVVEEVTIQEVIIQEAVSSLRHPYKYPIIEVIFNIPECQFVNPECPFKQCVNYSLIYNWDGLSKIENFFTTKSKNPLFILFEDEGTPDRMNTHQRNYESVNDINSLAEFIYYLDRNVVHDRGGGSFAEWMAMSGLMYLGNDIKGLNPDKEMWSGAISSSLSEFKDDFLSYFQT